MTKQNKSNDKRKLAVVVLAGLAATGLVGASAASLNGISEQGLGADAEVVGSCDTDGVTVSYDTTYAGDEVVELDSVTIGDVALGCNGLAYEVQLYTTDDLTNVDTVLVEKTGTITFVPVLSPDSFTIDTSADGVDAEDVEGIAITISGND